MYFACRNNATEFPETNDGKRRAVPIISVKNTPYADSTENFPTINKGEAVEDMEQTRVKIGVKKLLDLVSGMLSHDKEFHVLDFRKIHEDQGRNLSNILENNEINTDGTTTEDMEKYKFNTSICITSSSSSSRKVHIFQRLMNQNFPIYT